MKAVALSNGPLSRMKRTSPWWIVLIVSLIHLGSAAFFKWGLPDLSKPRPSEITIELGAAVPGGGGSGLRAEAPPAPARQQVAKSKVQDDLATQRAVDTPKSATVATAAPAMADSAAAGAPTVDADYKAAYLNNPKPPYPPMAFQLRIEGTVKLKAYVQPDGSCGEVLLAQSSGNELLDRSAMNTVAQWKFVPAKAQGKDVAQWVSIPITFSIKRR